MVIYLCSDEDILINARHNVTSADAVRFIQLTSGGSGLPATQIIFNPMFGPGINSFEV